MCGIAGIYNFDGHPVPKELLSKMVARMLHRGPDAQSTWANAGVGFAHSRLSIIDLEGGTQPMTSICGRYTITYNGEVYNHIELRDELHGLGHRFATRSDTEVVLEAYRQWGADCVLHLNGQWAFGIWDSVKKELFLSRDRFGIRPLYTFYSTTTFVFASELKALMLAPEVPRHIERPKLGNFLRHWSPIPRETLFSQVREVRPGHSVVVKKGISSEQRYWRLEYSPSDEKSFVQAAEELRGILSDAVRLRLRADVPVGVYLSGGLDSTVNAALITKLSQKNVRTFSISFEEGEFDEHSYQNDAVDFLKCDHQEYRCSNEDIARIFPKVIWHTERPLFRTAPAPLFLLSRHVRDADFKVVLSGEGADEMLGGYDLFKETKIRDFWSRHPKSKVRPRLLRRLYPYLPQLQHQSPAYLRAFFHINEDAVASPFFSHLPRWDLGQKTHLFFHEDIRHTLLPTDDQQVLADDLPEGFAKWPPFERAQYLETLLLLPGYLLSSQGDRMGMAHSIEARFPFLDHRLAEWQARLPSRFKMSGLNEKAILKAAFDGAVPDSIIRRSKQPYRAPDAKCFFSRDKKPQPWVEEMVAEETLETVGIFDPMRVSRLVAKAKADKATSTRDNMALVMVLSTQLLAMRFEHNQNGDF
jgi:asparagine synthase (glutamine-hydrolysing)